MLYMCIEYHIKVNMYHVSAQGVDERMINVYCYYYTLARDIINCFTFSLTNKHSRHTHTTTKKKQKKEDGFKSIVFHGIFLLKKRSEIIEES